MATFVILYIKAVRWAVHWRQLKVKPRIDILSESQSSRSPRILAPYSHPTPFLRGKSTQSPP